MFAYRKGGDLEAGTSGGGATGTAAPTRGLYPGMNESPEMRWALIRKIYAILSLPLLLTAAVAAVVVKVRAIPHFFVSSNAGLGLYIFLVIFPFIGEQQPPPYTTRSVSAAPDFSVESVGKVGWFSPQIMAEYIPFFRIDNRPNF